MTSINIGYAGVFLIILIVIGIIDFKRNLIPNKIVFPAMVAAIFFNWFLTDMGILNCIYGGLIGMGFVILILLMNRFMAARNGVIGGGDMKLIILVGLITGYPIVVPVILVGTLFGFMCVKFYQVYKFTKHERSKELLPFAPYFCLIASSWLIITLVV